MDGECGLGHTVAPFSMERREHTAPLEILEDHRFRNKPFQLLQGPTPWYVSRFQSRQKRLFIFTAGLALRGPMICLVSESLPLEPPLTPLARTK